MLKLSGVVHWTIPVNDLEEARRFYTQVLGMPERGPVGDHMYCVTCGDHNILLCQRAEPLQRTPEQEGGAHHAFYVDSETFDTALQRFGELKVPILEVEDRGKGVFTGRSLYFLDPSGNRLELLDPSPPQAVL